jgi:hypothetical protein
VTNEETKHDARVINVSELTAGMFLYFASEYRQVLSTGIPLFADGMDSRIIQLKGFEAPVIISGRRRMWAMPETKDEADF